MLTTGCATPALYGVTTYWVTAVPPLPPGAVQLIVASELLPPVAVPIVGALGTQLGVAELDAPDAALLPAAFTARTVKV